MEQFKYYKNQLENKGDRMNFVPKERSRATIKRLLEERQKRSDAREVERRKNYVCTIKKRRIASNLKN